MPRVSVCIPTYNYADLVGRAIESVLVQSAADLELHVIDDQSTDATEEVVAEYLDDPRVQFHSNPRNLGLFGNFNRCFELAGGEYVKILCADDWLHPRSIEDAVAALDAAPTASLATSPGYLVDYEGRMTGMISAPFGSERMVSGRRAAEALADGGNVIGMPTHVLMRGSAIEQAGRFEPEFEPASDVHLWLKLLAHGDAAWVPDPRCYLRIHQCHTHDYGDDPTEAVFRVWEDVARREPGLVDRALLDRARYREAARCLLYVAAHSLSLQPGRARRVARAAGAHVRWRAVLPRFAADLPRLVRGQLARVVARATKRLVVYEPGVTTPRLGPRLSDVAR